MSLIYLASPYNHPSSEIREERFNLVCHVAARLIKKGVHLFCPIAHSHPIAVCGDLPRGWEYWQQYNRLMLSNCSALWIVEIDGWKESQGIRGEIAIARELGIEIRLVDYDTCYISQPKTNEEDLGL